MNTSRIGAVAGMAVAAIITLGTAGAACSATQPSTSTARPAVSQSTAPVAAPLAPTAEQIAARMKLKGATAYTAATDPNNLLGRQGGYLSKISWGDNLDNSIEVFPSHAGALARGRELASFGPPLGDGYDYVRGPAIIRLGYYLTQPQAYALNTAFRNAVDTLAEG